MNHNIINHYNNSIIKLDETNVNKINISDYSKDKLDIISNIIKTDKIIHIDDCINRNLLMFHGIYFYNLYCNFLNEKNNYINKNEYFRKFNKYFKKAIKNGNKKALLIFAILLSNIPKNNNWLSNISKNNNWYIFQKNLLLKKSNKYFLKAVDNKVENALGEYALFLQSIKKTNKADKYFNLALETQKNKFDILLNYAIFLDTNLFSVKDYNKINNLYETMEKMMVFTKITENQQKKFYFNYAIYFKKTNNYKKYIEYLDKSAEICSSYCIEEFIEYFNFRNLTNLSNDEYNKLEKYNLKLIELENYDYCWFYGNLLDIKNKQTDKVIYYYNLGIEKINCTNCMINLAIYYAQNNIDLDKKDLDKIENLFLNAIYEGDYNSPNNLYYFYNKFFSKEKADNFIKSFFSEFKYKNYIDIKTSRDITIIFINKLLCLTNISNLERYVYLKKAVKYILVDNYDNELKKLEDNDIHIKIFNLKKNIKKINYQCDICYEVKNCIPSNCFSEHYMCYDCYFMQYNKPCHICRFHNNDYKSIYIMAKNLISRITSLNEEKYSLQLDNAYLQLDNLEKKLISRINS